LLPAVRVLQVSKFGSGVWVDGQEKPNEPALQPSTLESSMQVPTPVVPPLGAEPPADSPASAPLLSPAAAEAPPLCTPLPAEPVCLPADPSEPESPVVPFESGTALSSG
jgi:hypothetical protein